MTTKEDIAGYDLDDEVADLIRPHLDPTESTLASIAVAIDQKRQEAIAARSSSGIEGIWEECEDAYIGIDDANRGEFGQGRWGKPMSSDGPVTAGTTKKDETTASSTVYLRLTSRYVDAGKAKLCEILLPPNDKAFSISETPLPDLIKAKDDHRQVLQDGTKTPLTRAAKPGEIPELTPPPGSPMMAPAPSSPGPVAPADGQSPPSADGVSPAAAPAGAVQAGAAGTSAPPQVPLTVSDLAKEKLEIAHKSAKMAETRIYDWLQEAKYRRHMRKVIFDSGRCGSGVLKGPFPNPTRSIVTKKAKDGGVDIEVKDDVKPSVKRVDFWNCFPDPACGEDIHDGDYFFERDFLSTRGVRKLKKITGYIETAIDAVLEQGPSVVADNEKVPSRINNQGMKKGQFEIWFFYGMLTREEMNTCTMASTGEKLSADNVPEDKKQVYAIVTMINQTIVRATINPLDSGNFPYHIMCWQRRSGYWAGIGIGEQLRAPQRMLNASVRALLNNAGLSAGAQIVLDQGAVRPANGQWKLTPNKIWYKGADTPSQDVNEAFAIHEIPSVIEDMLKLVDLAEKQAENATSIPLVTQGQSGQTTPETLGGMQLQDTNANQLLRDIGWEVDDSITEPVVNDFYEWLLLDPDVPEEEKGEFVINAQGSSALVERAIQDQVLVQLPALSLNPVYKLDPAKCVEMFLRSKRLDPMDLQYTEAQQEAMSKQPPPVPVPVQVAQINASAVRDGIVAKQGIAGQTVQHEQQLHEAEQALAGQDSQNDAARINAESERTRAEQVVRLHEIQMKLHIATLDYANKQGITLAQAKAQLAKTAMTLQAQRELNAADHAVDLHKHHNPPPEPGQRKTQPKHIIPTNPAKPLAQVPGRAPNGEAFEQ